MSGPPPTRPLTRTERRLRNACLLVAAVMAAILATAWATGNWSPPCQLEYRYSLSDRVEYRPCPTELRDIPPHGEYDYEEPAPPRWPQDPTRRT